MCSRFWRKRRAIKTAALVVWHPVNQMSLENQWRIPAYGVGVAVACQFFTTQKHPSSATTSVLCDLGGRAQSGTPVVPVPPKWWGLFFLAVLLREVCHARAQAAVVTDDMGAATREAEIWCVFGADNQIWRFGTFPAIMGAL